MWRMIDELWRNDLFYEVGAMNGYYIATDPVGRSLAGVDGQERKFLTADAARAYVDNLIDFLRKH